MQNQSIDRLVLYLIIGLVVWSYLKSPDKPKPDPDKPPVVDQFKDVPDVVKTWADKVPADCRADMPKVAAIYNAVAAEIDAGKITQIDRATGEITSRWQKEIGELHHLECFEWRRQYVQLAMSKPIADAKVYAEFLKAVAKGIP